MSVVVSLEIEKKIEISERHGKALEVEGFLDKEIILGIRPEHIYDENRKTNIEVTGKVTFLEMLGSEKYVYMDISGREVLAKLNSDSKVTRDENLTVYIDEEKLHFFDKETNNNILYKG